MDYCISDIHGYYDLFCRLLEKIRFGGGDKLYVLGDIIDKGPDSIRLAKLLFSMPDVYCIAGNHEYDFLKYYRALMMQTEDYDRVLEELRAYFSDGTLLDWEMVDRFDLLPFYIETDRFIGVHAGIPFRNGDQGAEYFAEGRKVYPVRAYARAVPDRQGRNSALSAVRRGERQPEHCRLLQGSSGYGCCFERRIGVHCCQYLSVFLCK